MDWTLSSIHIDTYHAYMPAQIMDSPMYHTYPVMKYQTRQEKD